MAGFTSIFQGIFTAHSHRGTGHGRMTNQDPDDLYVGEEHYDCVEHVKRGIIILDKKIRSVRNQLQLNDADVEKSVHA